MFVIAHNYFTYIIIIVIPDIVQSGPGLAFVAYPEAILQMPLPIFWSIMFFLMLFILGIGSQLAGIVAIKLAIQDSWPALRGEWKVVIYYLIFCLQN